MPDTTQPLKIADINDPKSTNLVNKWADGQKQILDGQAAQIKSLQADITKLKGTATSTSSSSSKTTTASSGGTTQDVTGSRAFGSPFRNGGSSLIWVHGYGVTAGSGQATLTVKTGATSTPSTVIWENQWGATTAAEGTGFLFPVPAGLFYQIDAGGSDIPTLTKWYETTT